MAAYFIVDLEVTDPKLFEEYRPIAAASIAKHGGRYLVRGGKVEPLEGGWEPGRVVVLEFPTAEQARAWYRSGDYAPGLAMRTKAARSRVILVEGVPS
jgi:uncharacterized protein (DUF1330 family)